MLRFSIVIPCRNAAEHLPETIATLSSQTFANWEAIAIDDGSTDATGMILAAWAARDARVRMLAGPCRGPSASRNQGVAAARGEILAFLDADDLWAPEKLAHLNRAFAARQDTGALFARVAFFGTDPTRPSTFSSVPEGALHIADLLRENPVCTTSNLAVSRMAFDAAGPFREDLSHAEDVEFLIRLAATGTRIEGLAETLTLYRMSPFGLSADLSRMHHGWRACVETAARLGALPSADVLRAAEAVQLRYLARRALRVGAPGRIAAGFALSGATVSPRAFFAPVRRGGLTFAAALVALVMPAALRRTLFSE